MIRLVPTVVRLMALLLAAASGLLLIVCLSHAAECYGLIRSLFSTPGG